MNKKDLIKGIAEKAEISDKQAEAALNAALEGIVAAVCADDSVRIVGFGTFEARTRAAKEYKNPLTGETVSIPETKVPAFKPGKNFKDLVKG